MQSKFKSIGVSLASWMLTSSYVSAMIFDGPLGLIIGVGLSLGLTNLRVWAVSFRPKLNAQRNDFIFDELFFASTLTSYSQSGKETIKERVNNFDQRVFFVDCLISFWILNQRKFNLIKILIPHMHRSFHSNNMKIIASSILLSSLRLCFTNMICLKWVRRYNRKKNMKWLLRIRWNTKRRKEGCERTKTSYHDLTIS